MGSSPIVLRDDDVQARLTAADAVAWKARGIALGNELGRRRVGAIGAVAVDALARPDGTELFVLAKLIGLA